MIREKKFDFEIKKRIYVRVNREIFNIIKTILSNKGISLNKELSETTLLKDDLLMDSFDLAELTVRIEAKFGIDIFETKIPNSIGDIVKMLKHD